MTLDKDAAYVHGVFEELEMKDDNLEKFLDAWNKAEASMLLNQ